MNPLPKDLQGKIDRLTSDPKVRAALAALTRKLVDEGRIVQAGWQVWETAVLPKDAPTIQRVECRRAFFAGAQHLWASTMTALEADQEPTEADLRRLTLIDSELRAFFSAGSEKVDA
jgi:hypothetical protein